MATIDTLITNAENRAAIYASGVDILTTELRSFVDDLPVEVNLPPEIELSLYAIPPYESPTQTATPNPVYEPTTISFPTEPTLVGVGSIDLIAERTEPVLETDGLFEHPLPTMNLPTLDETPPDFQIDEIVAELSALVTPSISDFVFPELHVSTVGDAPDVTLPTFDAPAPPDTLRDPDDYGDAFESAYSQMAPEMQAFVDDKLSTWVSTYAPEYNDWLILLQSKASGGIDGGVLPDQFENALFNRAQGRTQQEYDSTIMGILDGHKRSGFMEPPGAVNSALLQARLKNSEALANQATDIYLERRRTEVQHIQFIMGLMSGQITSIRNTAISYAQIVGSNMALAVQYANSLSDKVAKLYEHLIERSKLAIDILRVINEQYDSKLKAALSAYEGYKLELQAESLRTDLDLAKIKQIEAKINAEGLNIQKFTAIVEAVSKKANIEELKIKEYEIRADIFDHKIKAQLAGFDVYKAAMDGDKSKLEGELSKITIFDSLINMDTQRLEAQVKQVEAQQSTNELQVQKFKAGADMYKLGLDTALNKFVAQAEIKKLAQSLYGQELTNAIEEFKVGIEIPKLMMESVLKQYALRMESAIETAKIEIDKLRISEHASQGAVDAYKTLASAALGSLNTVASSAISATA